MQRRHPDVARRTRQVKLTRLGWLALPARDPAPVPHYPAGCAVEHAVPGRRGPVGGTGFPTVVAETEDAAAAAAVEPGRHPARFTSTG